MKNFDDFMKTMDSKDWSLVAKSISEKVNGPVNPTEIQASLLLTATILKEYHNWLNSD